MWQGVFAILKMLGSMKQVKCFLQSHSVSVGRGMHRVASDCSFLDMEGWGGVEGRSHQGR